MTLTGRPTARTAEHAENAEIALAAGAGLRPAFVVKLRLAASRRPWDLCGLCVLGGEVF